MAHINVTERIKEGHKIISSHYDLSIQNILDILAISNDEVSIVGNSFRLGYAQGVRATKAELKRKRG